jgi:hypothetical protein
MRGLVIVALAVSLSVGAAAVWADGKFFSAANDVMQPDQKALLWHDGGRETLLLQVKYEGDATDFGWVVPVPERPKLDVASSDIFYELAWITQPVHVTAWWSKHRGMVAGGVEGVTVVEQAQVGPYDATVLAATDARGLTAWLEEHGYAMPPGAARVLKSYVDQQWYYVAVRINAQRVYDQLLADLQQIDPEIESLEEAPGHVADRILTLSDEAPGRGERQLQALVEVLADRPPAPLLRLFARGEHTLQRLLDAYGAHGEVRARLLGKVIGVEFTRRFRSSTSLSEETLAEAAREAVRGPAGPADDPVGAFAKQARRDILQGVPWPESAAASVMSHLREPRGRVSAQTEASGRYVYESFSRLVATQSEVPPLSYEAISDLRSEVEERRLRASDWGESMVELLQTRRALHSDIAGEVADRVGGVEMALSFGAIEPLRLDFDCKELVYPLHMTSLNGAPVDLQLYVLSDHRIGAEGFETTFAGRLDEQSLHYAPETTKLVAAGRDYLTELRATLAPEQMTADLLFARAATDEPYREEIVRGGPPSPFIVIVAIVLLIAAVGVVTIIYSSVRRALARRRA